MLSILSAILGFAAPFLPELLKYFTRSQDNAHELAMMKLQLEAKAQEHLYRMEEINVQGDIAEAVELHKPMSSFGVQLLDAARGQGLSGWAMYPVFYLFAIMDFMAGMVRPAVTYAAFGFYMAVKWAQLTIAQTGGHDLSVALLQVWSQEDLAIVVLVLSYWFGQRSAKAAFGGSAMNSGKGS